MKELKSFHFPPNDAHCAAKSSLPALFGSFVGACQLVYVTGAPLDQTNCPSPCGLQPSASVRPIHRTSENQPRPNVSQTQASSAASLIVTRSPPIDAAVDAASSHETL